MVRWLLLFALPILGSALLFEAVLVRFEDFTVNFFSFGHTYGAPFVVGVGPTPSLTGPVGFVPGRFSVFWFAVDVIVTAAIAGVIAWFLRVRNAWAASVGATVAAGVLSTFSRGTPPIPIGSFGFSYWIYWLVAFLLIAAAWIAFELDRAFERVSAPGGRAR